MSYKHIEDKTLRILEEAGISHAPVNVQKIGNHLNVDIQSATLETDISGLFVIKENKPYVRYNETESEHRQRFTIAHELGHFVLHKDIPLFVDRIEKVMFRNSLSTTGEIIREREANAFAAALLMPKLFVEQELGKVPPKTEVISYLANIFNVSSQAMSFRLSNLGYDFGLF